MYSWGACVKALHICSDYGTCGVQFLIIRQNEENIILHFEGSCPICTEVPFYLYFKICSICGIVQWRTQEFCSGGGFPTNSVEDRGQGSGGGSPLVRGSGGNCNFTQISQHIVKSY